MASFQPNMENAKNFKKPEEYKLFVTNLPRELTEEGIFEIFDHYGEMTGLFYRPHTPWAFVSYKTYREAEYVLRDLHDKPPLYLKVSFAIDTSSDKRKDEKLGDKKSRGLYEHLVQESSYNSKAHVQSINRGKRISAFYKERLGSSLPINRYESDDLLYPVPTDPYTYDPYESLEPYDHRNALWTRGTVTVTRDGKRHVSYGRGYTSYEIPNPHPKIETLINKIHEKRLNGLYEHGEDTLKHKIKKCNHCGKPANMKCERCSDFYCSRDCQLVDWPYHKKNCYTIPALIENIEPSSTSSNEENIPTSKLPQTQKTLRRPRQTASHVLRKGAEVEINRNTNIKNTDFSREENFQNDHQIINNTTKIDNDVSELITTKKDNTEKKGKISSFDALQIEENLAFKKGNFLSTTKFTNVKIVNVDKEEVYWVQNCNDKRAIMQMEERLMQMIKKNPKVKPVVGNMYAYKCEGSWKRVRIISLNPTKIFLVDYGTTKSATDDDFRQINLEDIPPYAIKICLSPKAKQFFGTQKLNNIIPVRAAKFTKDMTIVDGRYEKANSYKSESDTATENSQSSKVFVSLPNILDSLSENVHGLLDVRTVSQNNVYGVTLELINMPNQYNKMVHELNKYCNEAGGLLDREKISIGQLVCGKMDILWYRGCVVGLQPFRLALIDETIVVSVTEVTTCPEKFLTLCKFGVTCTVTTSNCKLNVNKIYAFNVISCTNEIKIEIETEDKKKIEAVLTQWEPRRDQIGIRYFDLKDGSEVCITAYLSQNKLYVRSLQTEDQEKFHKIMQNVAKCAQSAPFLEEPPVIGEMVLAQYTDDNFYRAIVTKVEEDEIMVSYVDYGNGEKVSLKKLKVLPEDLKVHSSCAAKVILKDVPTDVAITKDLADYFVHLTGREIPLICHFDGIPSEDGVSLTMANGQSVNEKVKQLLIPNWKKDNENDRIVYTVDDIKAAKFEDGSETRAIVLNTFLTGVRYIMCPVDIDLITNVYDILPGLMNEYCEKEDYYIPRKNELCLGLYDDNWYRALCSDDVSYKDKCQLFFLDYGNMEYVAHENIRAMTKDFLTPASLSNICTVVNLAPKDTDGNISPRVLKRISELVTPNENVLIKIITSEHEGCHTIELPEIHDKLVEEGLI